MKKYTPQDYDKWKEDKDKQEIIGNNAESKVKPEENLAQESEYFDPLDRKLRELALPISQIASGIIKIGSLLFLWTFSMVELVRLHEPNSWQFFLYWWISAIPPILLDRLWHRYVSWDKKKNPIS